MASQADSLLETYGARALDGTHGVQVVYSRGGADSAAFTGTWQDHDHEVADAEGMLTKVHRRDFVFAKSSLVVEAETLQPRAGDSVKLAGERFEVLPLGDRPAAEELAGGFRWKVHTKRVTSNA